MSPAAPRSAYSRTSSCRRRSGRSKHGALPARAGSRCSARRSARRSFCRAFRFEELQAFVSEAEDSAGGEEDHGSEQGADAEVPVFGVLLGEVVLRDEIDDRADEGAIQASHAAEDQHDEEIARRLKAK